MSRLRRQPWRSWSTGAYLLRLSSVRETARSDSLEPRRAQLAKYLRRNTNVWLPASLDKRTKYSTNDLLSYALIMFKQMFSDNHRRLSFTGVQSTTMTPRNGRDGCNTISRIAISYGRASSGIVEGRTVHDIYTTCSKISAAAHVSKEMMFCT